MLNINNEKFPFFAVQNWHQACIHRKSEQGGEMNRNRGNIIVKTEQKEAEKPELGQVHTFPNQGKMKRSIHMQHDKKPVLTEQSDSNQMMTQQSGAMQNLRAFLQQSSQNMAKPEQFSFPPRFAAGSNTQHLKMLQMGGGNNGMLQKYWPLLPAPPSFTSSVQKLKQFSLANKSSDVSWPMLPSTQLSMGLPNPATNYLLRGSSDLSVNSSNRENDMHYLMKREKKAVTPVGNEYPNMVTALRPATFNYQLQADISGGQEIFYSNTNHHLPPGQHPIMLSNQVTKKEDVNSTCYTCQGTPQTFCKSPPLVYYNQQSPVQQFAGSMAELQEPLKENPRNKVKQIVEEDMLLPVNHYPPKHVMDQNSRDFIDSFSDFTGSSQHTSSSSSRQNRRHGKSNNAPLYSIRSKASDFHVDPILRAFAISMKKKGKVNCNAANCRNNIN